MPSIDIEVFCKNCGEGLCRGTDVSGTSVYVEPCKYCMNAAEEDAADRAYSNGYQDGVASVE